MRSAWATLGDLSQSNKTSRGFRVVPAVLPLTLQSRVLKRSSLPTPDAAGPFTTASPFPVPMRSRQVFRVIANFRISSILHVAHRFPGVSRTPNWCPHPTKAFNLTHIVKTPTMQWYPSKASLTGPSPGSTSSVMSSYTWVSEHFLFLSPDL